MIKRMSEAVGHTLKQNVRWLYINQKMGAGWVSGAADEVEAAKGSLGKGERHVLESTRVLKRGREGMF